MRYRLRLPRLQMRLGLPLCGLRDRQVRRTKRTGSDACPRDFRRGFARFSWVRAPRPALRATLPEGEGVFMVDAPVSGLSHFFSTTLQAPSFLTFHPLASSFIIVTSADCRIL